jgi:hypothetical protein
MSDMNVRYWPKADMPSCTANVRFRGGKADVVRPLLSAFQRVKKPAPLVGHRTDAERPFWQDQTQMVPWGR